MQDSAIQKFNSYGLIDNEHVQLLSVLKEAMSSGNYEEIDITVGFLFLSGLKAIEKEMGKFFNDGGKMRIVMGSVTNRETYEALAIAYHSLEDLKEEFNRRFFSHTGVKEEINTYSKAIGVMDQTQENYKFIDKLKKWIENGSLEIRVYTSDFMHAKTYIFKTKSGSVVPIGSVGSSNFSFAGLHANTELNAIITSAHLTNLEEWFEKIWKSSEDFNPQLLNIISTSWAAQTPGNFPPPYWVLIRGLMELYGPIEAEGKFIAPNLMEQLYEFQRDAVVRAVDIINRYGGVLISDVVGLGKSFIGLALLQHFSIMSMFEGAGYRPRVAIFAPPKLVTMWESYLRMFHLNGVVFSTGKLLRGPNEDGTPSHHIIEIQRELADVDVILIDEAHKFSNPNSNSYANLQRVIGDRKVILLTATPYRKEFKDIVYQIQLFMPGEQHKLPISPSKWTDVIKEVESGKLDPSYVLREIMVRRTRRDIVSLYGKNPNENCIEKGGKKECFPKRELKTMSYNISSVYSIKHASIEDIRNIILDEDGEYYEGKAPESYRNIYDVMLAGIRTLLYARYDLYDFVKENLKDTYPYKDLKHAGRNLRGLMKTHYLKRLESSVHAFYLSVKKSAAITDTFLKFLEKGYLPIGEEFEDVLYVNDDDPRSLTDDEIDKIINDMEQEYGDIERSPLRTYKLKSFKVADLKSALEYDLNKLNAMVRVVERVHKDVIEDPWRDAKLRELAIKIDYILSSSDKRKVLVFSEFEDTVKWVYNGLLKIVKDGKVQHPDLWEGKLGFASASSSNVELIAARFSPKSMSKTSSKAIEVIASSDSEIDVLITTDVMSEGMNLQDANYVINYDIHWTPYKIIQRIGRIDRIGSEHEVVHVINFLPETDLEKNLNLIEKVKRRADEFMTTLGEDGKLITEEDKFNPSAIEAIYGGNLDKVEEEVEKNEISITTTASKVLKEFADKNPKVYEQLKEIVSIRSVGETRTNKIVAFFVCSDGMSPQYYTYEYVNGEWKRIYLSLDYFITNVKEEDKPVESYDMENYYKVAELALNGYRKTLAYMEGPKGYKKTTKSKYISELLKRLRKIGTSPAKNESIKNLAMSYRDMLQWGIANVPTFRNEVKNVASKKGWKKKKDEDILEIVKTLLDSYGIPAKKKKAESTLQEKSENYLRPHITAGLILTL